jgi:hypothetical protein
MQKLDEMALGLAIGILCALSFFLLALAAGLFGWGVAMVEIMMSFYRGYGPDLAGATVGAIWGFGEGYVFGVLTAYLYNILRRKK